MKLSTFFFNIIFGIALLNMIHGCAAVSENETIISGEITDASSGEVIEGALVEITSPEELSGNYNTTNDQGIYSFSVEIEEPTDIAIQVSYTGYSSVSTNIRVAPGSDVADIDIELGDSGNNNDGGNNSGNDDEGVKGESGGAASLILTSVSDDVINIEETGGIVNSSFTFQVQDSAGRTLSPNKEVDVLFEVVSGPGGESITPEIVETENGSATSNLFAGNTAGVVKLEAKVIRDDIGLTIRSKPVAIAIHGGFPDLDHFSISAETFNFEGYARDGIENSIGVIVGDKFSNPVKPGTAVYFNTTGGVIEGSQTGHTDGLGRASVILMSGGDRNLLNHPTLGYGYATITATTVNEFDQEISRDINVLFSGPPKFEKIQLNPSTFTIPANGGETFDLTVTDINNNPLPAGTKVTIEVAEGLEVTPGEIEIPNALLPGSGVTEFSFSVADTDDQNSNEQDTQITVKVETPARDKAERSFGGTRAKTAGY